MYKIILKPNEDKRIRSGHQWVFSNEIAGTEGDPANGDLADLYDSGGKYFGSGFFNRNSLISFRLLSSTRIDSIDALFKEKILNAYRVRKELYPGRNSYRLVFSESDFIPGLIIDKYENTCVLQIYSYGIERNISTIVNILSESLGIENIFSKNESYFRLLEGLPGENTIYKGNQDTVIISDGRVEYRIDFSKGHKTGFYFDQCDNREFMERLCGGKSFLDAFCNAGGFGLHAALAGASEVTFIDSSDTEIQNAKENFALNKFSCYTHFVTDDVFDAFNGIMGENKKFDVISIDPPAFAKNKKSLPTAKKGYEKLNRMAMSLINSGGYLATSSCSYHLKEDEFLQIVNSAAAKTGKQVQLIHFSRASLDHPVLPAMPETTYLKFAVFKVT